MRRSHTDRSRSTASTPSTVRRAPPMPRSCCYRTGTPRRRLTAPERVAGLVTQNGDIYPDAFGPKYDALRELWEHPGPDARRAMAEHVSMTGFRDEFAGARRQPGPAVGGSTHDPRLDASSTGVPSRASAADADRVGSTRRIHARGVGAGVSPGPSRCRPPPGQRRALAVGDAPRRGRSPGPHVPRSRERLSGEGRMHVLGS